MTICVLARLRSVRFSTFTCHCPPWGTTVTLSGTGAGCHQSLTKSWLVQTGTKISALNEPSPSCTKTAFSPGCEPVQVPANSLGKVPHSCRPTCRYVWLDGE